VNPDKSSRITSPAKSYREIDSFALFSKVKSSPQKPSPVPVFRSAHGAKSVVVVVFVVAPVSVVVAVAVPVVVPVSVCEVVVPVVAVSEVVVVLETVVVTVVVFVDVVVAGSSVAQLSE
jgi:uncharacterized protein YqhQ